jgi:hypothetical protein
VQDSRLARAPEGIPRAPEGISPQYARVRARGRGAYVIVAVLSADQFWEHYARARSGLA